MRAPEPWSTEERALRIAYERSDALHRTHPTFERAMADALIAHTLRLAARCWLRAHGVSRETPQEEN
jgi:hypothetical protein